MALVVDPRFVIELEPARRRRVSAATYRRRRLAVLLAVVGLLGAALLGAQSGLTGRGDGPATVPTAVPTAGPGVYIVQPGDSLWTIAERLVPPGEVASLVDDLVELNGGASLRVGQVLVLPD